MPLPVAGGPAAEMGAEACKGALLSRVRRGLLNGAERRSEFRLGCVWRGVDTELEKHQAPARAARNVLFGGGPGGRRGAGLRNCPRHVPGEYRESGGCGVIGAYLLAEVLI